MTHKKIHRFLVQHIPLATPFEIAEPRFVHQIKRVLKLRAGESIALFENGSKDTIARITDVESRTISLEKEYTRDTAAEPATILIAAVAIAKGSVFETIVQKLTELGAGEIVPLVSGRTVKTSVRIDRLQTISDEALEQCGGSRRVTIHPPLTLEKCLERFPHHSIAFVPEAAPLGLLPKGEHTIVMYIGPEGGWNEQDMAYFDRHHTICATLGPRVLRSDTAAIVGAQTLLWHS